MQAQDTTVENYLQKAGVYADIYNGKVEAFYNPLLYDNLPYYFNSDFTDASIVYKNNYYPSQKVRLDLFKEQLIVLLPEKRYGIILNSQQVESVYMYNKTFVWMTPPKESGLKQGFYIRLAKGENAQLFCRENFTLQQNQELIYTFDHKKRYYLSCNDQYYTVKNKNSFTKIFPQYKKQINQFSKDKSLNFKEKQDESLTALAGYCNELLKQAKK
jgi:hypothetical protein